jgi:hypothetical protein
MEGYKDTAEGVVKQDLGKLIIKLMCQTSSTSCAKNPNKVLENVIKLTLGANWHIRSHYL